MARLFTAESWQDDETEIKVGMVFTTSQLKNIIKALQEIENGESKEDYIVLESNEDDEFKLSLQFI